MFDIHDIFQLRYTIQYFLLSDKIILIKYDDDELRDQEITALGAKLILYKALVLVLPTNVIMSLSVRKLISCIKYSR